MSRTSISYREVILQRITELPPYRLKEVLRFIDFLKSKQKTKEDPILNVTGCLSGSSLSAEQIEQELYGSQ